MLLNSKRISGTQSILNKASRQLYLSQIINNPTYQRRILDKSI